MAEDKKKRLKLKKKMDRKKMKKIDKKSSKKSLKDKDGSVSFAQKEDES